MTVSDAARERLLQHHWPGNVRELEHAIERAVIVGRGRSIARSDLPETIHGATARVQPLAGEPHPPVPLAEVEKNAILSALRYTDGNKRAAAELLGIYRATLYSKLRRHGIVDPPGPAAA